MQTQTNPPLQNPNTTIGGFRERINRLAAYVENATLCHNADEECHWRGELWVAQKDFKAFFLARKAKLINA